MNGRTVIIGSCVVGSLIGLGFLAHYVYGEPEKQNGQQKDNPNPEKWKQRNAEDNYVRKRKKRPEQRHNKRKPLKVEPKMRVVKAKENTPPSMAPPNHDEFPLRLGSKGKRVERLQVWLMRNYGWTGKISGVFDEKTETLVKRFLKNTELDEATYYKMKMEKPVYEQIVMR